MRIKIHTKGCKLFLMLPTALATGALGSLVLSQLRDEQGRAYLTRHQARTLLRGVWQAKKQLAGTALVEVKTADGDHIRISL